nr:serine/threonine protein kinase [Cryptococcus depauperatus CBS 7855]
MSGFPGWFLVSGSCTWKGYKKTGYCLVELERGFWMQSKQDIRKGLWFIVPQGINLHNCQSLFEIHTPTYSTSPKHSQTKPKNNLIPDTHPSGILLAEAPYGSLQTYIDTKHATLSTPHCWSLWEQATEAIVHLHSKGVIHSDLRPENFLVHQAPQPFAGIWLCDFGGSFCAELGLDGGHLPDLPFGNPQMGSESTPATDIFSLGSIFYAILTGYWPFLDRPPNWTSTDDYLAYYDRAVELLKQRKFPDVSGLDGGDVIKGCWDLNTNQQRRCCRL